MARSHRRKHGPRAHAAKITAFNVTRCRPGCRLQTYHVEVGYSKVKGAENSPRILIVFDETGQAVKSWKALFEVGEADGPIVNGGVEAAMGMLAQAHLHDEIGGSHIILPVAMTKWHIIEIAEYDHVQVIPCEMIVSLIMEGIKEWLVSGAFPGSLAGWRIHMAAKDRGNGKSH